MGDCQLREGMLLGLGNPLLDISANTTDSFLENSTPSMTGTVRTGHGWCRAVEIKYGMKPNDAILAEESHKSMYQEMIDNFQVEYIAGGACQNTMRVAQWILEKPNIASFMGCIGHDKFGQILESKAKEAGVNTSYQYDDKVPTGTCAVVITNQGGNRSLCANLSAANCFSKDHIDKPENRALIEKADYFYITGFFLTVSPPTMLNVATHACTTNKVFCMNLSAPFLSEFFEEPMMKVMSYVDILFGNEQEAQTFSRVHSFGQLCSQRYCGQRLTNLPSTDWFVYDQANNIHNDSGRLQKFIWFCNCGVPFKASAPIGNMCGNDDELMKILRTDNIEEIALKICALPKENKRRSRVTIITQGKDPVILAHDGVIGIYPAMNIKQEDIIDTNGAGDAFVGGFLAQYVQQKPLDVCIKCGIYAATEVIKQSGCTFPKKPNFICA